MSARENVMDALITIYRESGSSDHVRNPGKYARQDVDEFVNEILREAAEKIRAEVSDMDGWPEEQHVARKYADLIDPDKS